MNKADIAGFLAQPGELNLEEYLLLEYYLECEGDPRHAAAVFCSEQSTVQWRRPGTDEDLRPLHAARLLELEVLERVAEFSYGLGRPGSGTVARCRVRIAHPHRNFGPRIPNMLSAILGEGAFFSPGIPVVKLLDIHYPGEFLKEFSGPRFGVAGLRSMLAVPERPLLFAVIKPNIGLSPEPFADIGFESWVGGIDVAKDDEMLGDVSWCPFDERTQLLGAARRRAEDATGHPKIYLANITDEIDRMKQLHDNGVRNGANAFLINVMATGFSAVRMMRAHSEVPLIAHFPLNPALTRLARYGLHSRVITALQRLCGCDAMIMPGFAPRMLTSTEEVLSCFEAAGRQMGELAPALPVTGGGNWAGNLEETYRTAGNPDFGMVVGRGVSNHPLGARAGAAGMLQAWDAVRLGVGLQQYAETHEELAAALMVDTGENA